MKKIALENFRCFRNKQDVRLAPLTLIVGENSTGKTSFMALIRALWDVAYGNRVPDFKEDPYDLGSFDEIAHHRGAKGGRADTFKAGFSSASRTRKAKEGTDNECGPQSLLCNVWKGWNRSGSGTEALRPWRIMD